VANRSKHDLRQRRRAERYGRAAEYYAGFVLRLKGYRILARRYVTPFGEIDFIAIKNGVIIFIEVKYRTDRNKLTDSLTPKGQSRIIKAAHYYMGRTLSVQSHGQRFDLIFIAPLAGLPLGYIQHIKDAWRTY